MDEITTIPLRKGTRARLKALGRKGESYDTLVNRILDQMKLEVV